MEDYGKEGHRIRALLCDVESEEDEIESKENVDEPSDSETSTQV